MHTDLSDKQEPDSHNTQESEQENSRPIPKEIGGRDGLDPSRFGDWEKNGRCIDF